MPQFDPVVTPIDEAEVRNFKANLQGELVLSGDPTYDEARLVWNGLIDRRPALIARCANAEDVMACVNFARQNNLLVVVRGGGHNVAGHATCDGGLVIDLSGMRAVEVDPQSRIARVGGGATLGDMDPATQRYGLATPGGVFDEAGHPVLPGFFARPLPMRSARSGLQG